MNQFLISSDPKAASRLQERIAAGDDVGDPSTAESQEEDEKGEDDSAFCEDEEEDGCSEKEDCGGARVLDALQPRASSSKQFSQPCRPYSGLSNELSPEASEPVI